MCKKARNFSQSCGHIVNIHELNTSALQRDRYHFSFADEEIEAQR